MAELGLNELQVEVLGLFFSLPESEGFILASGAGLVAAGLSTRPTEDIDLFSATGSVERAGDALEEAVRGRGWSVERVEAGETFRRLLLTTDDDRLLVDLARDAGPIGVATITPVGPTSLASPMTRSAGSPTPPPSGASSRTGHRSCAMVQLAQADWRSVRPLEGGENRQQAVSTTPGAAGDSADSVDGMVSGDSQRTGVPSRSQGGGTGSNLVWGCSLGKPWSPPRLRR